MGNSRSLLKQFLKYVSLNILGQAAFSLYTMADTFFVSAKLGTNGLTALNIAFPIFCIISGLGLMIGMGAATRFSLAKSRGELEKGNRYFTNALFMIIGLSFCFIVLGIFAAGPIGSLLGADESIYPYTKIYLQVMMLFTPAFMLNHLLQCFVRNDGKPTLSMAAMITGSMANILLDYVFIFPCDLGIFGAILATGLSPIISMLVISPYLLKRKNSFKLIKTKISLKVCGELSSSGVPSLITEFSSGLIMFLFNFLILRIEGNVGVAAFGIVSVISLVVVAMFTGLSQGIQPLISSNFGSGDLKSVKKIFNYSLIALIILASTTYSIIFFGSDGIANIFNSEKDSYLQELAIEGLRLYFIATPFIGFNILAATYFSSTERTFLGQLVSILRGLILLIPLSFLLSYTLEMLGIWITYPISEALTFLIAIGIFSFLFSKLRKKQNSEKLSNN